MTSTSTCSRRRKRSRTRLASLDPTSPEPALWDTAVRSVSSRVLSGLRSSFASSLPNLVEALTVDPAQIGGSIRVGCGARLRVGWLYEWPPDRKLLVGPS